MYKIIKEEKKTVILVTHDISEAISMADRIIVLTKRPTTIKSVHNIDLGLIEDKTPLKARSVDKYKDYFNLLWKELDYYE